jgi:hypothetical protein
MLIFGHTYRRICLMPGYFSFQRCLTSSFVKAIYFIGFLALSAGGIGLLVWSSARLYAASIPRALGWYYVALGVGTLLLGNLVWRVFCEIWIVPFNIHERLVSLDQKIGAEASSLDVKSAEVAEEVERAESRPHRETEAVYHPTGVLGLS